MSASDDNTDEVARLRAEAEADLKHADALEAWAKQRVLDDCPACGSQIEVPPSAVFSCPACSRRLVRELRILTEPEDAA